MGFLLTGNTLSYPNKVVEFKRRAHAHAVRFTTDEIVEFHKPLNLLIKHRIPSASPTIWSKLSSRMFTKYQ